MASFVTALACFVALLGISSCAFENIFHDVYRNPRSERDLRQHLFKNYDKLVRPVEDIRQGIKVELSITPLYVRELDEKKQLLILESWIAMKWSDEYLKWNPDRFGNITALRVPSTEVWRPDFSIYTAPDPALMFPTPNTNAMLYSNGDVLWVPMVAIHSRCPILKPSKKTVDCSIKIGSWTFSEPLVDMQLTSDKVDLTKFTDTNPDWKLMDAKVARYSKHYPCCPEAYVETQLNVTLKRRPEYRPVQDNMEKEIQDIIISDILGI